MPFWPFDGWGVPEKRPVIAEVSSIFRSRHVTPSRVSQILALLQLAPDIQEAILFLPPTERGRDPVTERDLRPIAAKDDASEVVSPQATVML